MIQEQREKRKIYQRDYMRRRRVKERALKSPVDASPTIPAPVTSAKPENAAKSKPEKPRKPTSERAKHREYRATLAEYLEDALTDPVAPMSGSEYERMRLASCWMGWFEKLDRLEASADGKADLLAELRLSIALECLRRLSGERPAGSAPVPAKSAYSQPNL